MFGTTNPLVLAVGVGLGLAVGFVLGTALFRAGCALADVNEPGWLKSFGVYAVAALVCQPAGVALVYFAGRYDTDPSASFGPVRAAGVAAAILLSWLLAAVLYAFLLPASLKKGLLVSAFERILGALLGVLVSAVVLVALAVAQIVTRPEVQKTGQGPPPQATCAACAQVAHAAHRPAPAVPS
jgi:hypothetical protein